MNNIAVAEKEQDDQDVDDAAGELFTLFEHHSSFASGVSLVSEEGLFEMSHFFGAVPEEDRGYVFLSFLSLLYEDDYRYDMQQFLQMDGVEEADEDTTDRHRDSSE